ncbi:MAG: Ig-like domain-containing protein [Thermoplasmatota archaeon]
MSGVTSMKLPALVIGLLMLGPLALVSAAGADARGRERAIDLEPNNSRDEAVPISDGEIVEGTLLTDPSVDREDWYRISVPYGKVLNASLYLVDYNETDRGRYNFHLVLYGLDSSATTNRWETVIGIQTWNPSGAGTMYIRVIVNLTSDNPPQPATQPGSYLLSASLGDPRVYSGGSATGNITVDAPPGRELWRIDTPPGDDQLMQVKLRCPQTGVVGLRVYHVWPIDGGFYQRNGSWSAGAGGEQVAVCSGLGGSWYAIAHAVSGHGCYTLSTQYAGQALDKDNFPSGATLVEDLYPHPGFADQGVDWVDWWVVNARAGKPITEAYLTFTPGAFEPGSYFHLSAWDKDLSYISGDYMPQQGGGAYAQLKDITVGYDGPVYFAVRAVACYSSSGGFVPGRGWYKLTFTLPNDPPVYIGGIPEVHVLEDGTDESLVLSEYFTDPDGDTIFYSPVGTMYKTRPSVNRTTGRVTFAPQPDWSGAEDVRFRATDDGPGNKSTDVTARVVVEPVNDPPVATGYIEDAYIMEEQPWRTPDLRTIFYDTDDLSENLMFTIRVVSQETRPPGAQLSTRYEEVTHAFRIGPPQYLYGTFELEVGCTDGHNGTAPAAVRFNLTVTHKNHPPGLKEGVEDPLHLTLTEGGSDSSLLLPDLFSDPDLPQEYANDTLIFSIAPSAASRLTFNVSDEGRLMVDTGSEEYVPGVDYQEFIKITAADRFGLKATLNISIAVEAVNDPPYFPNPPEDTDVTMSESQRRVFSATASDVDSPVLTYTWYLNGVKEPGVKGYSYTFAPDFEMGGATYALRVEVSDGQTTISASWNITVLEINRPPSALIKLPLNMSVYKKGGAVAFMGEGADPDGDALTFIWRTENGTELGRGPSITYSLLPKGTHTIVLEVNDSRESALATVTIVVKDAGGGGGGGKGMPGLGAPAAALALTACLLLTRRLRGAGEPSGGRGRCG